MKQSDFVVAARRNRGLVMGLFDVLAIAGTYAAFTRLRYWGLTPPWSAVLSLVAVAALTHVVLAVALKLYRGRLLVGSNDETIYLGFVAFASCGTAQLTNVLSGPELVGRTVPFGAAASALVVMLFARAQWRRYVTGVDYVASQDAARTLVVGAGEAGQQLLRSMRTTPGSPYVPIGLLDDDPWRRHLEIDGVKVKGTLAELESVCARLRPEVIVVAIPSAGKELLTDLSARARALEIPLKVLPAVVELFDKRVTIRDVRDIHIADLLGRGQVDTDVRSIGHFLRGKRVLVTGAGGSIGSELCRQITQWEPGELMMLDRDESALHGVQLSISGHGLLDTSDVILCDIRDAAALRTIFEDRRPEVVFHAAALKHLPMLEQYPLEAVKTNVHGTIHVLEAAEAVGVQRFVNISTDKAADPTSVLGLSKRVAERVTADVAREALGTYISVRFGNVLGSRGSVLTAWAAQIAGGGPVTVTHPDATRYFMTIQEACELVLQAGAIGRDGEVLILDMGKPVRIDDVARQLIAQSGDDIEIVYTGLREGEKLDETLIAGGETGARPFHDLISHVVVPHLDRLAVTSLDDGLDRVKVKVALENWSEVEASDSPSERDGWPNGAGHDEPGA